MPAAAQETAESAMAAHYRAVNDFNAAQMTFMGHCRLGQWDDADRMCLQACNFMEDAMDAFRRSCELMLAAQ